MRSSAMRRASRSRKLKRFPSVWLLETPPDGRPTTRPVRSAWVIEGEEDVPRLVSAHFRQRPVLASVTRFFQALFSTRRLAGTLVGVAGLFVAAYFAPALARHVNWKATARRDVPITNQYRAERGQPVWTLLDTGRVMKMPFEQMTLLDHAVNAALAVSAVALQKDDRAEFIQLVERFRRISQQNGERSVSQQR